MSKKIKKTDIKIRTFYFFDNMISTKSLDLNKIKEMKSHTKIFLFTTLDT